MRSEGVNPDVVSYATMIKAAVGNGDVTRAEELLEEMNENDVSVVRGLWFVKT